MAIRNYVNSSLGPRRVARIVTVHTQTRKIEGQLKDGGNIQISLFDVPPFFVWPQEGEYWIVRQDGGYWKLANKFDGTDDEQVNNLGPGEAKIAAEIIKTPSGKSVVVIDNSSVEENQVIGYKNGNWVAIDQTGGTGGGNTILYGSGAPANSLGSNGNFYIDTNNWVIYGPKSDGSWPSGISLVGPQGPTGATGASGVIQAITPTSPITASGTTTVVIGINDASTSSKGAASFNSADFDVVLGQVTIKTGGIDSGQLANGAVDLSTSTVTGILPVSKGGTGITSFGTGVATFLQTPSSANLASAVTDETGSGALVFGTAPSFITSIDSSSSSFTAFATPTTLTIGGSGTNTVVAGSLTVNGTTTTINSTTLSVDDKNIELGSIASPSNITADGGGITLKGASDKTLNWISSTEAWTSSENFNLVSGKSYQINGTSVLSASTLGSGIINSSLTSVGTLTNLTVTNTISGSVSGNAGTVTNGVYTNASNTLTGTQTIQAASTQDAVKIAGRAGGSSSYAVTVTPTTLTANRTLTLPNTTGNVVTTGDTGTVTSAMIANSTIVNEDVSATANIVPTKIQTAAIALYPSAAQTIPNATTTNLALDTVVNYGSYSGILSGAAGTYNAGTGAHTTSGSITTLVACWISINASIIWSNVNTTNNRAIAIRRYNSSNVLQEQYAFNTMQGAPFAHTVGTINLIMAADDYIVLAGYQNSGGALGYGSGITNARLLVTVVGNS